MVQRPLKGSRISSFYPVKTLPSLSSLDSAFQLQEYISLLIRLDVHDVETIVSLPGKPVRERQPSDDDKDNNGSQGESKIEVVVDEQCWIYEQLRRLAQDLSHPLITMLQQECTRATCSEMKAAEWLYLCVAHGNDGATEQCCAIDYILHTLDSATALLNSPRAFPSRLTIPEASRRHFPSLARRLGRIFAHAYFHHREAFEQAEAESSLYARFLALTSKFDLVPSEFLVIPPRLSSMHDSEDGNERLMDTREIEEPGTFLADMNAHSQRRGSERWGLSDSSSVIDLAAADESENVESHIEGAKKRWRSDTMVDRDTYLMGKKKREEGLDKVFNEETNQAQDNATQETSQDDIPQETAAPVLHIAEPAPSEPHIPAPEPSAQEPAEEEEEEEPMKPHMFVPSQARQPSPPEPADPILEEPPVELPVEAETPAEPAPAEDLPVVRQIKADPKAEESADVSAATDAEPKPDPQPEPQPSADITAPETTDVEPIQAAQTEEMAAPALVANADEPSEAVPVKEEDVTEAQAEEAGEKDIVPETAPAVVEEPKVDVEAEAAQPVVDVPASDAEKNDVEDNAKEAAVEGNKEEKTSTIADEAATSTSES